MKKEILCLVIVVIFSIIFLLFGKNGYLTLCRLKKTYEHTYKQNEHLVKENRDLERRIERLHNDPKYLKTAIRQTLGLTEKGEVLFFIKEKD
jgi:cell division protein FtsB